MEEVIALHVNFKNDEASIYSNDFNEDIRNLSFLEEYLKKPHTSHRDFYTFADVPVVDSIINSRAVSSESTHKRSGLYKQAQNIKNVTLVTPKFKRISDNVTKVFGLNDPPPGFGLSYPKYYYLEQKRPQPMSPLKVWRGFNGNIYFEPIVCNTLNNYVQENQSDIVNKVAKVETQKQENKLIETIEENDDEVLSQTEIRIITPPPLPPLSQKELTSENLKTHTQSLFPNIKEFDAMSTSTLNGTKNYIKFSTNSSALKPKVQHNNSPNIFVTKEITFCNEQVTNKRNRSSNTRDKKSILPNLSAVKRNNSPYKGLAYKEVKNRIPSEEGSKENLTKNQDTEPPQNVQKETEIEKKNNQFEINFFNASDTFSTRPTYKEMLKGIRKGVALASVSKSKNFESNFIHNDNYRQMYTMDRKIMSNPNIRYIPSKKY